VFRYYVTAGDQPAENVLYLRVVEPTAVIASSASGQRGDESVERNCGSSLSNEGLASRKRSFLRQMRIFTFAWRTKRCGPKRSTGYSGRRTAT
jgi:hypothetical protein